MQIRRRPLAREVLASALLAGLALWTAWPSTVAADGQEPMFRSETRLVSLFVTVTDSRQRLVPDLVQDDFTVLDNGHPQPIVFFENQAQPITVVVMLDTSASMTGAIGLLRDAAEQFLIRMLPEDRGKVGAFNDKIEVTAEFVSDRDDLIGALGDLDYGNATRLYDALALSLDELKGIEGRRVVLVFSDGEDTASRARLNHIVDRARSEEVMVYAIGLEVEYFNGVRMVRSRPDDGLRRLAEETGGGYFELEKTADLAPTFTRVAQELHSQYVVGFTPTNLDGRVHRLEVRLKDETMTARARRSYLADPDRFGLPGS